MTALTKNSDYWKDRAIENEKNARTTAEIGEAELRVIFSETSSKIQKEVDYWWNRFAKNNSLTISEAKKLMSNKELDELNWDVKEYIKNGIEAAITQLPYIESQLENASAKFHISRLNALKIQVLSISNEMFADVNKVVKESMKKVYNDTYYKTAFNIQDAVGIYSDFTKIDDNLLEKILSKPWAEDGSNFSERIWGKYRPKLVNRLHKDLTDCVSRGRNPNEYTQAIAKDFDVGLKQAGDLMLSEYNYFNEKATQDCMDELDVEEYEVLDTLDGVTCSSCAGMGGKHYPLKDAVIGINSPPFHPRCRCTTIPYFNDEFTQGEERAYRGEDGKTHYTKAKTYDEWKKEFVSNDKFTSVNNDDIIKSDRLMAQGQRKSFLVPLSDDDKAFINNEIKAIEADISVFQFRNYRPTGYSDERDKIYISSSVFPSNDGSMHPTDLLSVRATLAHEYYGHRKYRGTKVPQGSWNDEFRASYMAAKNCPNLSDEDRRLLVLDALERAKTAGVSVRYNNFIRKCLYGY